MGFAIVRLGWSPAAFWASTPHELYSAVETLERMKPKGRPDG